MDGGEGGAGAGLLDEAIDDDPVLMQLEQLHAAWANKVGTGFGTKTTVKNLVNLHGSATFGIQPGRPTTAELDTPSLSEALHEIAGNPVTSVINTKKLSAYLSVHVGRIIDGRRHCVGDPYQGALTWWVEDVRDFREIGDLDSATLMKKSNISQIETAKSKSRKSPISPKVAQAAIK